MAYSPELSMKIVEWRRKAIDNTLSTDEQKEAIALLRQDRVGSHIASTSSRTKKAAAAAPIDTQALLAGLMAKPAEPANDEESDDASA